MFDHAAPVCGVGHKMGIDATRKFPEEGHPRPWPPEMIMSREIKDFVPDYLAECQQRGILRVRVIHGKGIGNLRRTVHAILAKHPEVISYALASEHFGGWGATIVHLRPAA